jgi:integrase
MNPMMKVKRPAPRKDENIQDESEKAFTVQELNKVLDCVKQEPLKWQVYINLAADSACRRGELCGLWWSDIDWDTGTVTIRRNLQYTPAKGIYAAAKGG